MAISKQALPQLIHKNNTVSPKIVTALAPMQDVTTLDFMRVIHSLGSPDLFFTEYFRVHETSRPEEHILQSITQNPSNKPVFAQLIGESIPHIQRTIHILKQFPIAGIDLNMGCPAPKVYKKNVGGGLLKDVQKIDTLLGSMREAMGEGMLTVKMRIGFETTENFEPILELINKHNIDLLTVHGRTVKEMYRSEVRYPMIQQAVASVQCPVLANGNITSLQKAQSVQSTTKSWGVMIGRSAIRNPWIFKQIGQFNAGDNIFQPTFVDVYQYIDTLYHTLGPTTTDEFSHIAKLKKFMNFLGLSIDSEGHFLHAIRRVQTKNDFFTVARKFLLDNPNAHQPIPLEPYSHLVARPSRES